MKIKTIKITNIIQLIIKKIKKMEKNILKLHRRLYFFHANLVTKQRRVYGIIDESFKQF